MSTKQNDLYFEDLKEAQEEVFDCIQSLNNDLNALRKAKEWTVTSRKNLKLAKLRLEKLKNKQQ